MLEIPYNIPMVFATLAILFFSLLAVWKSSSVKTKNNTHFFALAWVLWGLFQSVLSLNRWYMDRKGGWIHFVYPWLLLLLLIAFVLYTNKGKRWSLSLNDRLLFAPALASIVMVPIFQGLYSYKQISSSLYSPLLYIIPVLGAMGLFFSSRWNATLTRCTHLAILTCIAVLMTIGYGGIPNAHQAWDYANPNYAFQHFPYTLIPNLIYPLLALFSAIGLKQGK